MKTEPTVVHLKDYQPHPFHIGHSDLEFALRVDATTVVATHQVRRRSDTHRHLELDCEDQLIEQIAIDGVSLAGDRWSKSDHKLVIRDVPDRFVLTIRNRFDPSRNTQLIGLYLSDDMLCTQCEAEGFRRITPSIDRPDNLATYRVTLTAELASFPVLLSNGNLEAREVNGDTHSVIWFDPFPKPTYLFALVAGSLAEMRDSFTTASGRAVDLRFYARDRDIEKCRFAMDALKRSFRWDEEVYGREYDLDRFNVVAVSDFNMGAMENKSLNIFNTKYVLADDETATDLDFHYVERVIAHEYFHNWSGNRVTCRDWFQLSLKEGLTVFRDQQFSADMGSRGVQRISDVNLLRNRQFPEDAGPMAHPVRPQSYSEINNFYTVTIYEKGAEVVRMLHTLTGAAGFRRGTDLYFNRHDGQAVTTDEFVQAISDANDLDLDQFRNWYDQAGTPEVTVNTHYDADAGTLSLDVTQSCPATPGQEEKQPFVIPLEVALFSYEGKKLYPAEGRAGEVLTLCNDRQQFRFDDIHELPVLSILRRFSAPVKLLTDLEERELSVLFRFDDDPFNRWEAGQKLFEENLLGNIRRLKSRKAPLYSAALTDTVGQIIESPGDDPAFTAKLLSLPGEAWLGQLSKPIDPGVISDALTGLKRYLAATFQGPLTSLYQTMAGRSNGRFSQQQMGIRALRDVCLDFLGSLDVAASHNLAVSQFDAAANMTDRMAALTVLASSTSDKRASRIESFYREWKDNALVLDKWFRVQAVAQHPTVLDDVVGLTTHREFDPKNPNKVYALILGFTHANPAGFHRVDGKGYDFLADWVLKMDKLNPQVAARLMSAFNSWRDMTPDLGKQMRLRIKRIQASDELSADVREIVNRALA